MMGNLDYYIPNGDVGNLVCVKLSEEEADTLYGDEMTAMEDGTPTLVFDTASCTLGEGESIKLALPTRCLSTNGKKKPSWYALPENFARGLGKKCDLSVGLKVNHLAKSYFDTDYRGFDAYAFYVDDRTPILLLRNVIVSCHGKQVHAEIEFWPQFATHILIISDDYDYCDERNRNFIPECFKERLVRKTECEKPVALAENEMLAFSAARQSRGAHYLLFDFTRRYYILPYDFIPVDDVSRDEVMERRKRLFNQFLVDELRVEQPEPCTYSFEVGM